MLLAGQARSRARRASTTLASAWRMRSEVVTKKKAIANVITVQVIVLHISMCTFHASPPLTTCFGLRLEGHASELCMDLDACRLP